MNLNRVPRRSSGLAASQRAGVRQRVLRAHAAKKDSSPWSSEGPKRGGGKGGSNSNKNSGSSNTGGVGGAGGNKAGGGAGGPWKDSPSRAGLPARPLKGAGSGASGAAGAAGSRIASRLAPPPETTITDPISITLLDELSPTESAAEPKWGTFCSHLSGEWVGQYAAYTPWEGKPEPAWLDERGKYINVVYTRALEHRYKYQQRQQADSQAAPGGPAADDKEEGAVTDVLLRKIGRCTKLAALPDLRLPPQAAGEVQGGRLGFASDDESADADIDLEALAFNTDGIVVFDGGNYSAGPEYIGQQQVKLVNDEAVQGIDAASEDGEEGAHAQEEAEAELRSSGVRASSGAAASTSEPAGGLGAGGARGARARGSAAAASAGRKDGSRGSGDRGNDDEDEGEDEGEGEDEDEEGATLTPTSTSVFEQCLVDWGSRTRMRLKLTLRIGQLDNGEVDVQVLRILLFSEEWLGSASSERLSSPLAEVKTLARPCTELPRPTPTQLQGSWNVFTTCATGVDELDPFSGEERVVWVYSSTEERQLWDAASSPPTGDDGGSFWLPGGIVLSLRMVDNYVPTELDQDSNGSGSESEGAAASANGNGQARAYPRGLCISTAWLWREASVSVVEREYDGYGFLREVRLAQGVKGGWSGGRM